MDEITIPMERFLELVRSEMMLEQVKRARWGKDFNTRLDAILINAKRRKDEDDARPDF